MHLVGFIIRIFHFIRSPESQRRNIYKHTHTHTHTNTNTDNILFLMNVKKLTRKKCDYLWHDCPYYLMMFDTKAWNEGQRT